MSLRRCVGWLPGWQFAPFAELAPEALAAVVSANKIVTATPAAARLGILPGQSVRWARSLCPKLLEIPPSVRLGQTFEPILVAAETIMAGVLAYRPGLFFAPAKGAAKWHGGEDQLCLALTEAIAEASGAECRVGVATGVLASIVAAREQTIVPEGAEGEFLAPRPLTEAVWARGKEVEKSVQLLMKLGISTLGELAAIKRSVVGARFGKAGLTLHDLASGKDVGWSPVPRSEASISVTVPCEEPAASYSQAALAVRICVLRFLRTLSQKSLTCARVKICASTTAGKEISRNWILDPGWGEEDLTDRVKWQLEAWATTRAESGMLQSVSLQTEDLFSLTAGQAKLWNSGGKNFASAKAAAQRIQALLGPRGATKPTVQGGFDPRSQVSLIPVGEEVEQKADPDRPWEGKLVGSAPAWVLETPQLLTLVDSEGRGIEVSSRLALSGVPAKARWGSNSLEIADFLGPYVVLDKWWASCGERSPRLYLRLRGAGTDMLAVWLHGRWWVDGFWEQSKIGRRN